MVGGAPDLSYLVGLRDGEVPEWLNGSVSKTVERVSVPRVRIPLSPPETLGFLDISPEPHFASKTVLQTECKRVYLRFVLL